MTQVNINPFPFSNTNKRYHTYDYYLKSTFGGKLAKITLDCGFSCPNIDGTVGRGGCIYCLSGSVSENCRNVDNVEEQYRIGVENARRKWQSVGYIPYMQAYTNTHTSPEILKEITDKIALFEGAKMIAIATRADCLENEKIEILNLLSERIPVTVELGLQSSSDKTAELINRGHSFKTFTDCVSRLRNLAPKVKIGVHIINGLPGEKYEDMIKTAEDVAKIHPNLVKIHLMHVLEGTTLAKMYKNGEYTPIERDEYIRVVCDQLELLPPDTIIERVTGDGVASELIAPQWSKRKTAVINDIDKELFRRSSYQGIRYTKN